MTTPEPAFDADSLKRVEHLYRRQLADDPSDPLARVSLAWCLLMQALLRAGQESVLQALVRDEEGSEEPIDLAASSMLDQDAADLLEDCLRQTLTVRQISADPAAHLSAERILALVRLSGGAPAVTAAEAAAARKGGEVTRQVLRDHRKPARRRIPRRKQP